MSQRTDTYDTSSETMKKVAVRIDDRIDHFQFCHAMEAENYVVLWLDCEIKDVSIKLWKQIENLEGMRIHSVAEDRVRVIPE